jgi:hypothetical protein
MSVNEVQKEEINANVTNKEDRANNIEINENYNDKINNNENENDKNNENENDNDNNENLVPLPGLREDNDNTLKEGEVRTVFSDPVNFNVKHPLYHEWTLWFDNPGKKANITSWSANLKELITFDSVEEFWG